MTQVHCCCSFPEVPYLAWAEVGLYLSFLCVEDRHFFITSASCSLGQQKQAMSVQGLYEN